MIWLLLILPSIGVLVGVGLCLGAQRGRVELNRRRAERLRIEREMHWAERRLHDIAQRTLGAMLDEARCSSSSDPPRSA